MIAVTSFYSIDFTINVGTSIHHRRHKSPNTSPWVWLALRTKKGLQLWQLIEP